MACVLPACLPLPLPLPVPVPLLVPLMLLLHPRQRGTPAQVAPGALECPDCLCAAGPAAVSEQTGMETQVAGC